MDVKGFALITGAASGIGRACAVGFVREGAAGVALVDVSNEGLQELRLELEELLRTLTRPTQCKLYICQTNVADEGQVNRAITGVVQAFGRIDYAINAAGIAMKHVGGAACVQTQDWNRVLDVNLNGTMYVMRAAIRIMLAQDPIISSIDGRPLQRGSIVNFSSIQGVAGIPLSTAYAASKAAILGLTRSASEDYAAQGIRINAICPGYTETPLTTRNPDVLKAMQERVASAVPMQRMGTAKEIADGVLYLAGGRSSFVVGTALMVDGGYTQR